MKFINKKWKNKFHISNLRFIDSQSFYNYKYSNLHKDHFYYSFKLSSRDGLSTF